MINRTNKGASKDALFRLLGEGTDKLIIAVLLGSICLFVLYPILRIFGQSFLVNGTVSFEAFADVWKGYRTSLWNSLFSSVMTAFFCTFLSVAVALVMASSKGWVKALLMGVILITMVFVTHDQEEALHLADQIAIMEEGILVQDDAPMNIYRNPANDFVRDFLSLDQLVWMEDGTLMKVVKDGSI